MKISEKWLRTFVNPPMNTDTLAETITLAGLEVDAIRRAGPPLPGVVVAEIVDIAPHPDAERLRVCQVQCGGGEPLQIVCGAANAALGLKVPLAQVGAVLPSGLEIKPAKLRGVASAGMLCSAAELGLAESAQGLFELPADAPVGTPIEDYLELADACIEIDLTPNRGDCLSVAGMAREVAVLTGAECCPPKCDEVPVTSDAAHPVRLLAGAGCPRYVGRVIEGVDATRPTPIWMVERLRRAGVRSISALVDITNYVLLELGQPLHAFDLDRLSGAVEVRWSGAGESIVRLDEVTSQLPEGTLVVADTRGPVAIAGIMGGLESAVTDATTRVFLESAFFAPAALAGVARRLKLHTDASHRFERGVDFALPERASARATALILDICGGNAGPAGIAELTDSLPTRTAVALRATRLEKILGFAVDADTVGGILVGLGCQLASTPEGWSCTPPTYRFDLQIEEDLIEEVVRVYGYHRIPAVAPRVEGHVSARAASRARLNLAVDLLRGRDFSQAVTYSFIPADHAAWIAPELPLVSLENPISREMAVMRPSIWPGLVAAAVHNQNRQVPRVRLFEHGQVFLQQPSGLVQTRRLAGLACGRRMADQWSAEPLSLDFFDMKGDVEALLAGLGHTGSSFVAEPHPALHPGQSARISLDGQQIGWMGRLHPELVPRFDLRGECYLFELELDTLLCPSEFTFHPLSKFPAVRRDLAVVVAETVLLADVEACIRGAAGTYLRDLQLFDVYRGQSIDSDSKSLALGLIFQAPSSTLTDEDVDAAIAQVLDALRTEVGGTLRD